jgi:hypothetical protein
VKEEIMSRRNEDEIPPGLRMIIGLIMHGMAIPGDESEVLQAHRESHQEAIRQWEAMESELSDRFCPTIAANLIKLQRVSAELCEHGQMATAAILQMLCDLTLAAEGDQAIIGTAADAVRDVVKRVMAAREQVRMEMAEAKSQGLIETLLRAKANGKANGKPTPEPGTKAKDESKAEARARLRAEAANAKRKVDPTAN